jgi:regulation of enolase protein 1 (concanavalin A-like superfamily)
LCSPSSSPNSLDGNSSNVRSIERELEIVINFQDDVSCGQDVMLKCIYIFTTNAMLQFGVVACACFNFSFSKFVYMLGCPSFSTFLL